MTRDDATPLSFSDRAYLLGAAADMLEEGIQEVILDAVEEGYDPTHPSFHGWEREMRNDLYQDLVSRMIVNAEEAKPLVSCFKMYRKAGLV